jgi:hypothetical protein
MFERAGPCQIAVLGDLSREDYGDSLPLGQIDEGIRARSDLGRTAGQAGLVRIPDRLDGINHEDAGSALARSAKDRRQIPPRNERAHVRRKAQAAGSRGYLGPGLLAGRQKTVMARRGEIGHHMKQQRRLPDAGLARDEHDRRRDQPTPENPVDPVEPR